MKLYYVKTDLFGVKAGTVERFADFAAGRHLAEGAIEPFDPKNGRHSNALQKQEREAAERRDKENARLQAEFKSRGMAVAP